MTGVFGVVLGQIFLMFLYLIIGYVLYRTGLITQEGSKALAHLLLYCVLPCVVLKSFCIEYSAKGAVELAVSIAAGAGVLLLSMAVSWLFFRKDPMAQIGVAFSNAGFMGFPLVTAVLGGEAVFYAAGFVALLNALQWTYGQAKLSGDKKYIQQDNLIEQNNKLQYVPYMTHNDKELLLLLLVYNYYYIQFQKQI